MKNDIPDSLVSNFLDFASESELDIGAAAKVLVEYARQKKPELDAERAKGAVKYRVIKETTAKIENSPSISVVARVIVRTRVRYIHWNYFPEFHVVSPPREYWWCSIKHSDPSWEVGPFKNRVYLDELYHDEVCGKFWMPEPYLSNLPLSARIFAEFSKDNREELADTWYYKIDPLLMKEFLEERASSVDFIERDFEDGNFLRKPPYGSKGWRDRLRLLPLHGL